MVIFETDSSPGEWGFRLYIQPVDDAGQAITVTSVIFDSVPAYREGLRGKLDVTLQAADDADPSDNVMLINFDGARCSRTPPQGAGRSGAASSSEGGRLKLISSRGKQVYVAGSRWEPVQMHGLNRFTLDCKGPPTGRLEYRIAACLRAGDPSDPRGAGADVAAERDGEGGSCYTMADYHFVFWIMSTLCAPTDGLLVSSGNVRDAYM